MFAFCTFPDQDFGDDAFEGEASLHSDVMKAVTEVNKMLGDLKTDLVNRDMLVEQLGYALLLREHQLIVGPKGVGKSFYSRTAFSRISNDVPTFYISLTDETTRSELFGGLDLEQYKKGTYIFNTEGYIPRARFAILNEIFDAPIKLLRSLNDVLHERIFKSGPQEEKVMLHTAIGVANYFPKESIEAEAVLDRFVFKAIVGGSSSLTDRYRLSQQYAQSHGRTTDVSNAQKIDFEHFQILSNIIHGDDPHRRMNYDPVILVLKDALIAEYEFRYDAYLNKPKGTKPYVISDRTKDKAINLLGASALLNGRMTVEIQDLRALALLLPTIGSADEEAIFQNAYEVVLKQLNPADCKQLKTLTEMLDTLIELEMKLRNGVVSPTNRMTAAFNRVREFLKLNDDESVTMAKYQTVIGKMKPTNDIVKAFAKDVDAELTRINRQYGFNFYDPF